MFRQIQLSKVGLIVGGILVLVGFVAYATDYATLNLVGFFYGIPLLLGGFALSTTELKPVPFIKPSSSEILALRNSKATTTQQKIINDITRYRYGEDRHLDQAINYLQLGKRDEEKPSLIGLWENNLEGNYTLILQFESPFVPLSSWFDKIPNMERYFGPMVKVGVNQNEVGNIELSLMRVD